MRRRVGLAPILALAALRPGSAEAQAAPFPPLPDPSGWGIHVLTAARDPGGAIWLGTYGHGIYRLAPGAPAWDVIRADTSGTSIASDLVDAIAFGIRGEVWYGTVGDGFGLSRDGGRTWHTWSHAQLGREWQYVAPSGIATRGDTTIVATADGLLLTTDDGAHWTALVDSAGPRGGGIARAAIPILASEYVRRFAADPRGWLVSTLRGSQRLRHTDRGWESQPIRAAPYTSANALLIGRRLYQGTPCGLRPSTDTLPCIHREAPPADPPKPPATIWFARPIALTDNPYIDQTYRYGSTMEGKLQQHQGVEFNNPDGTPVLAIGAGRVVYAGPAAAGSLTVAIRHARTLTVDGARRAVFSVYYHNSRLQVKQGQRVAAGQPIARVGNTGRATNDHLHLEIHVAPPDAVAQVVDSLERFPPYTTNPELWIQPLPNTGIVAGRVLDASGRPVPGARIYGLAKPEPRETPFSYIETYGDRAHPHPLYGENFAVSDVPAGTYVLGTEIEGTRVYREVTVEAGKLTWVVFKGEKRER